MKTSLMRLNTRFGQLTGKIATLIKTREDVAQHIREHPDEIARVQSIRDLGVPVASPLIVEVAHALRLPVPPHDAYFVRSRDETAFWTNTQTMVNIVRVFLEQERKQTP